LNGFSESHGLRRGALAHGASSEDHRAEGGEDKLGGSALRKIKYQKPSHQKAQIIHKSRFIKFNKTYQKLPLNV